MRTDHEKNAFKTAVRQEFLKVLQKRIQTAQSAMDEAQASANSQEKSSAGDKYETSRAMGQIDRDMNAAQLAQALEEYRFLENLPTTLHQQVLPGAIIELDNGIFFAAIGLGQLMINNTAVLAISCKTPLFEQMKLKKRGDSIVFRNQELQLRDVY
jgi:hypothetical protein